MAVSHLKSPSITDLDATPAVAQTAGEGGPGYVRNVSGYVTTVAADSIDTTYRFVRVPSNAVVKKVRLSSAAQAAGAVDVGVYYPTIGKTGLPDLAANAIDQDFFASAVSVAAASAWTDVTNEAAGANASYLISEINIPLWQAAGLTTDPGGFFDIVATVTTAITTGAALIGLDVDYVL